MDRWTVLYDRGCPFCCRATKLLLRWDRRRRLRAVGLQTPEATRLLPGFDEERMMREWHHVAPDGTIHSGGDAIAPLLGLLPGAAPLGRLASLAPAPTRRLYQWVSKHRGTIARLLRMRGCPVRDEPV
jgi:predicted DCC family thiol-disulfide oxidoreductase YuxK